MKQIILFAVVCWLAVVAASYQSVDGLNRLVQRQLPECFHDKIKFDLNHKCSKKDEYDCYQIAEDNGEVNIRASTKSGLSAGLYKYLRDYAHVSISWSNSTLNQVEELPALPCPIEGAAVVPFRYHFNTVTFSYTTAFYSWEDWEHLIDWMALQGVNFPLAWTGFEKVLIDVLREFGFNDEQIAGFVSGPAFLAWNRFGNIQGDWNATLNVIDTGFFEDQFELQKKILTRMIELGMTPILPSFTGFVPREIEQVYPDAQVVNSTRWNGFQTKYTNVTFLDPMDPLFTDMQVSFMKKQKEYYGDVTKYYTLDQYNENTPSSGDIDQLKEISSSTFKALRAGDPDAIWVMQGWLFHYEEDFWSNDRIEAYLSGPKKGEMIILDLYSENSPQWERTKSYYGHDWIWCELHDFGGNMGLEGSLQILSHNFTEARKASPSLVGAGLTMEGQEGNQIVYDALLYQAWQEEPFTIEGYTKAYIQGRYGPNPVPQEILDAWMELAHLVYTNDFSSGVNSTSKSIISLEPALHGMLQPGHHSAIVFYDGGKLEDLWKRLVRFVENNPQWLSQTHFHYDMVDITRQVLSNRFLQQYHQFVEAVNSTEKNPSNIFTTGNRLGITLDQLEDVLYTDKSFLLSRWISSARLLSSSGNEKEQDYYEFQARNQITLWGPLGEIDAYASRMWAGLVSEYYKPIWQKFIKYVSQGKDANEFGAYIFEFKKNWQWEKWFDNSNKSHKWHPQSTKGDLLSILKKLLK